MDQNNNNYNHNLQETRIVPSFPTLNIIDPNSETKKAPEKKFEKNPSYLKPDQVRDLITDGKLFLGPPPDGKRFSSNLWKEEIVFFLYDSENGVELKHWYYCAKCFWVHNRILRDGNKTIREHIQKHKNDRPYSFDRVQLAALLANATIFGASNGNVSVNDFVKHLPIPDKW